MAKISLTLIYKYTSIKGDWDRQKELDKFNIIKKASLEM